MTLSRAVIVAAGILIFVNDAAGDSPDGGQTLNFFQSDATRGIVAPSPNAVSALSQASADAVAAADADQQARGAAAPDAAYVKKMQQRLLELRPASINAVVGPFVPTTNATLLADPVFAANLRKLYLMQKEDATALTAAPAQMRVIGGSVIPAAKDVVAAMKSFKGSPSNLCSGILIDPLHVLTAAHCYCLGADKMVQTGQTVFNNDHTSRYMVSRAEPFPGVTCPADPTDEAAMTRAVAGYDLAILTLSHAIPPDLGKPDVLMSHALLVRWQADEANNYFIRVGGFGFDKLSALGFGDGGGFLKFADIAISAAVCRSADQANFHCVPGRDLVAGTDATIRINSPINTGDDAAAACNGDSGGPAYAAVTGPAGQVFYPVAVVSRGLSDGCDTGSIYTLLDAPDVRAWLSGHGAKFSG